jgi:hypothetical protein
LISVSGYDALGLSAKFGAGALHFTIKVPDCEELTVSCCRAEFCFLLSADKEFAFNAFGLPLGGRPGFRHPMIFRADEITGYNALDSA